MTRAFELMLAEVHRYEGTVNQFLGDGDHGALRRARSPTRITRARRARGARHRRARSRSIGGELDEPRGISFRVRQGLNTGLVVVGKHRQRPAHGLHRRGGHDQHGGAPAAGRRARGAWSSRRPRTGSFGRLLRDPPLGEMHLKGKTEPVAAWGVVAAREARTRLDVGAGRGLTPFIGRDRELRAAPRRIRGARGGEGQVVFVVGEPGIGKSRLLHELRQRIERRGDLAGRALLSFGRAMAFHPLVDLLQATSSAWRRPTAMR